MNGILTTASTINCEAKPLAWVTINKNRQKAYENNYYLNDGTDFEIEMFNPCDVSVIAYISLNGKRISKQGIILKPGVRFFLERFIQENKKLRFESYIVEDNNQIVKKAIAHNGDLTIEFYKEKESYTPYVSTYQWSNLYPSTWNERQPSFLTNINSTNDNSINCCYRSCVSNTIETGRIEKGGESKQEFKETNFEQEFFPFKVVIYKLLPNSLKPLTPKTINEEKRFCPNCGKKVIKKGFKFCPDCGEKI